MTAARSSEIPAIGNARAARELLDQWRQWQRFENLSPRTIQHRNETMARFAREGLDIRDADAEEIVEFIDRQRQRHGWRSAHTQSNYYRVLQAWFLWLVRREIRTDNPLDRLKAPKVPRCQPRPCSTEALGRVLERCNRRRTRVMILLAAYQGLRVHEIAKVRGEDVRGGRLHVVGKGGVGASLPLHPLVAREAVSMPKSGWWFPSYRYPDEHIASQNVSTVIGDAFARAGIRATAHQLRHWFGTESLRAAGGNVRVAQELLRHASLATTQIYTQVDDQETAAAVAALPVPTEN